MGVVVSGGGVEEVGRLLEVGFGFGLEMLMMPFFVAKSIR